MRQFRLRHGSIAHHVRYSIRAEMKTKKIERKCQKRTACGVQSSRDWCRGEEHLSLPFFFCKLLVCGPLSRERLVGILQAGGRVRSLGCARAWMDAGDARLILICLLVRLGVDALRTLQPAAAAAAAAEVH